jgi:hypothetical protein
MTQSIQNNPSLRGATASQYETFPLVERSDASLVKKVSVFMQSMVEYMADTLLDCGRAVAYSCDWIDYSNASDSVKHSADRVKGAVDQFNLVGMFCEMTTATRDVMTKQAENLGQLVDLVGAYIASSAEFVGRLSELNIVSVSQKVASSLGSAESIAVTSLGLNGIREGVQDLKEGKPVSGSLLKIAKNTALLAIGVFSMIAAGVVSFAISFPKLSLCLLTAATSYLALKVAHRFHDVLALSRPPTLQPSV